MVHAAKYSGALVLAGLMAFSQSSLAQLTYSSLNYQLDAGVQGEYASVAAPLDALVPVDVSKSVTGGDPVSLSALASVHADRSTMFYQVTPSASIETRLGADDFLVRLTSNAQGKLIGTEGEGTHGAASASGLYSLQFTVAQDADYVLWVFTLPGLEPDAFSTTSIFDRVVLRSSSASEALLDVSGAKQLPLMLTLKTGTIYTLEGKTDASVVYSDAPSDGAASSYLAVQLLTLQTSVVPEPASAALMALGLAAIGVCAGRRKVSRQARG